MRYPIFILLISILASCQKNEIVYLEIIDNPAINNINGTWKVIAYKDLDTQKVITKDNNNSRGLDVILAFDDSLNPSRLSGRNTTNTIWSEFEYTDNRSIKIHSLGTSDAGQPEWGNKFNELVSGNHLAFEVNEFQLRLINSQKQLSAILVKE